MSSSVTAPLHFAGELFATIVALGAALALSRQEGRGRVLRAAGAAGFLALAAAEVVHGADFATDTDTVVVSLRTFGYVLLLGALLPAAAGGNAAVAAFPGGTVPGAIAAFAAAAATLWRHGRDRAGRALGGGLAVLAVAELLLREDASGTVRAAAHVVRVAGFALVSVYALAAARRSIRFRIVTGFVSLLLLLVVGVASAVSQVITRNQRAAAFSRVAAQAEDTSLGFTRRGTELATGLRFLVEGLASERGATRISREDLRQISEDVLPSVDFIVVLRPDASVHAWAGIRQGAATEVAGTDVALEAIELQQAQVSVTPLGPRGLVLLAAVPIRDRAGDFQGVAAAGFRVHLVLEQVAPPGGRALVFDGTDPRAAATTGDELWEEGDRLVSRSVLREALGQFVFLAEPVQRTISIGGVEHFASLAPLPLSIDPVGTVVVAEPAALVAATQRDINQILFLVTLGLAVVALALAVVAARRVTRPVLALTATARRVEEGDLSARAPVTSADEVGVLTARFNEMTDSLLLMTDELREAAAEEARLRARLETVVSSMGDGLIAVDREGKIQTCNPAASAILALPPDHVLERPVTEILQGRDIEGHRLRPMERLPSGTVYLSRHEGTEVPVALSSAPLRDETGNEVGQVLVLRDMTREHEIERMKTEFLSNVSHELRTPLTPIIGYSEIMVRREVPSERTREFAGGILDSARRLERIVGMLVDFSAMEGGRMSIAAEAVPLPQMVAGAVDEWRAKTDRHEFVIDVPGDLPPAEADPSLIRRALYELLDNAVKYSPDGGRITIAVSEENSQEPPRIRVDVSDEGIGIESEDLPHLFQDFRQLDASDTRTFGGLGLGLAFVKRIVEAHRGTITTESEPGRGTTFSFTLPAADTDGEVNAS